MAKFDGKDRLKSTLGFQALLYAGGELDEDDARTFEQRLADDQAAREALCQAAQVVGPSQAGAALLPDPVYRDGVRSQLSVGAGFWQRLFAVRPHRGHPLVWTVSGAAAALLIFVGMARFETNPGNNGECPDVATLPLASQPAPELDSLAETADIWAAMHPSDHLLKAHDDETRRRNRAVERSRLLKYEERRNRFEEASKPL